MSCTREIWHQVGEVLNVPLRELLDYDPDRHSWHSPRNFERTFLFLWRSRRIACRALFK